jgi:two-component system, chemotaxis family, protein-glutamate methylesterase/glutaminase
MPARRIRVLIVDDSAVVRKMVTDTLNADPELEVVAAAANAFAARDKIQELNPDVLTLDLEMPRMDGLTFLRILMAQRPMPVIVMSSLTASGSVHALEALQIGAVGVLGKPCGPYSFGDLGPQLIASIKAAAGARIKSISLAPVPSTEPLRPVVATTRRPANARSLILFGASTGGTEALREVLTRLPAGLPGIAIVQHIPPVFSKYFAERLSRLCAFEVREAADGDRLSPGRALIAPGDFHLLLQWSADHYRVRVVKGPAVWHQRPAVDVLFKSAVECGAAPYVLAGVLTGMGRDGADGLLRLRESGATTFAQDEASSVVYGMPRAAHENGAAQHQIPLDRIADFIIRPARSLAAVPRIAAAP